MVRPGGRSDMVDALILRNEGWFGMAKETIIRLVDDLDGGLAHETVRFELDGNLYEIDLSSKNAKKLRSEIAVFVDKGSRVSNRPNPGRTRTNATRGGPVTMDKEQNRAIREWAHNQGLEVADRGRIKRDVVDEFHRRAGR
jgi:Lsr2